MNAFKYANHKIIDDAVASDLAARFMEPRVPANLEPTEDDLPVNAQVYYPAILRALAKQLTVTNDFYYPLLGAANLIEFAEK